MERPILSGYAIDASVIIHWLFAPTETNEYRDSDAFLTAQEDLVAPPILLPEVLGRISGLSNASGHEHISAVEAAQASDRFAALGVVIQPYPITYDTAPRLLALGANLGLADATYVLLGERLGVDVITCDKRMIAAAAKVTDHPVRWPS